MLIQHNSGGARRARLARAAIFLTLIYSATAYAAADGPGAFEASSDVGRVERKGAATFDAAKGEYRLTGSGANIWGTVDAFHFLYKQTQGDLELSAEISWDGEGKNAHRKAGLMVRQDLEPDSPYADAVVHGDGLISLQFRRVRSGPTLEVKSPIKPPASIKLERNGDVFTLSVCLRARRTGRPAR